MFGRFNPVTLFEANGAPAGVAPSGGQGVADPAVQGSTDPQGQGGGTQPTAEGFNWGLFPDVPEQMRGVVEPHLRNVQSHVTKMEMELAPYKNLAASGVDVPTLEGLVGFSQRFEQDPLGLWLEMGSALQKQATQAGTTVIRDELDFDMLGKIARGEPIPDDADPQQQTPPPGQAPQVGQVPPVAGTFPPEVAQALQGLQQQNEQLAQELAEIKQGREQDQQLQQQRAGQQVLAKKMGEMREELKGVGWPEDQLTDDTLGSFIIRHGGNVAQATAALKGLRTSLAAGQVNGAESPAALELPNGSPKAPPKPTPRSRDGYEAVRGNAAEFLRRQNRAGAQG